MPPASPRVVRLFRTGAVLVVITVLMGSMVAATESGAACPTWPGCYPGQFGPKLHLNPLIEFTHRVIAGIGLLVCLGAGFLGLRDPGVERAVKPLPFVAAIGGLASAVFGALTVLVGIGKAAAVVDLTAALLAMAAAVVAAVRVSLAGSAWSWNPVTRGAGLGFVLLVVLHQLGIVVAAPNSFTRVISWPAWTIVPGDLLPTVQVVRIVLAVAIVIVVVWTLASARTERRMRTVAALVAIAVVAELSLGGAILAFGLSLPLAALYAGAAVGILAATSLLGAVATTAEAVSPERRAETGARALV